MRISSLRKSLTQVTDRIMPSEQDVVAAEYSLSSIRDDLEQRRKEAARRAAAQVCCAASILLCADRGFSANGRYMAVSSDAQLPRRRKCVLILGARRKSLSPRRLARAEGLGGLGIRNGPQCRRSAPATRDRQVLPDLPWQTLQRRGAALRGVLFRALYHRMHQVPITFHHALTSV